jgi:hypothetical protein
MPRFVVAIIETRAANNGRNIIEYGFFFLGGDWHER